MNWEQPKKAEAAHQILELVDEMAVKYPAITYAHAREEFSLLPKITAIARQNTAKASWEWAGLKRSDLVSRFYWAQTGIQEGIEYSRACLEAGQAQQDIAQQ